MKQLNHNVNCDEPVLPINDRKHSIIDLVQSYIRPLKYEPVLPINDRKHSIIDLVQSYIRPLKYE